MVPDGSKTLFNLCRRREGREEFYDSVVTPLENAATVRLITLEKMPASRAIGQKTNYSTNAPTQT